MDMIEICDRYKKLYTGVVYDVLEKLGYPHQVLAHDLRPLRPEMVVAGPAFTIKGISDPTGDPDLLEKRIKLFKEMTHPCIDVRDCGFDTQAAHYGEMNLTLGMKHGVTGAVIDGGIRDTRHILEMNVPVFARYYTPVEAKMRWSYYAWDLPVTLRGALTTAVIVNPGDFMFGDIDGVLSIPKDVIEEVLRKAEELVAREDKARQEYKDEDVEDVYRRYGTL
ncbi:MAG: RraA family protein [Pseudomonadota bacterium]